MRKILKFLLVIGALVVYAAVANAQQSKKVPRIGFLSAALVEPFRESFRQGLRELGYVEGQDIVIE